jgi:hypothetical protein
MYFNLLISFFPKSSRAERARCSLSTLGSGTEVYQEYSNSNNKNTEMYSAPLLRPCPARLGTFRIEQETTEHERLYARRYHLLSYIWAWKVSDFFERRTSPQSLPCRSCSAKKGENVSRTEGALAERRVTFSRMVLPSLYFWDCSGAWYCDAGQSA